MLAIIVGCFLFLLAVALYTRMMQFYDLYNYDKYFKYRFGLMISSLALGIVMGIGELITYGMAIDYFFYTVQLFAYVFTLLELIILCKDIIGIDGSIISRFVSFVSYSTLVIYFIHTYWGKCELSASENGVYFLPTSPVHIVFLYLVFLITIIVLIAFTTCRIEPMNKKRDEREVILLAAVMGSCTLSIVSEFVLVMFAPDYYLDTRPVFYLLAAIFYYALVKYHRSILVIKEDYADELSANDTDVVFVINDEGYIIFINKRAEVLGSIYKDEYIGRKFTDVFNFKDSELELFSDKTCDRTFGSSAEYKPGKCFVNLVIKHRFDDFNEILTSTVYVYNMESSEDISVEAKQQIVVNGELENIIDKSREITRSARVLLIDEDVAFLDRFQDYLKPYEMKITRAIGGMDGIERVLNGEFDIIFVAEGMIQLSEDDTVRRIRGNIGSYYEEIPIVYMTSQNINDIFMQMLETGFSDYIYKNLDPVQIDSVLTKWVWKRHSKSDA